jgi:hypothetical protein
MSTLRVYKVKLDAEPQIKLRIYKASMSAQVPVAPVLRVYKASLTAAPAVLISVDPERVVGPGEAVEIEAELLSDVDATWQWRRIEGPPVGLVPDGPTVSFTAPSRWNAFAATPSSGEPSSSTLVLGVTATADGVSSAESRCEVEILPQLAWAWSGSQWVGSRVAPA